MDTKEEIINEVKYEDYINLDKINELSHKYKKTNKEILKILKVKDHNIQKILSNKTFSTKIDLIENKEKNEIRLKIKEYIKGKTTISLNLINIILKNVKTTESLLIFSLGVTREGYRRVKNGQILTTLIIDKEIKQKVEQIKDKMQFERYYTKDELLNLCSNKVELEDFIRYVDPISKHYRYNMIAINTNPRGIWIGKILPLSNEFIEKNHNEILKLCKQVSNRMNGIYKNSKMTEIFYEVAYDEIIDYGGLIEKNFEFDKKLQINLFKGKAKCAILNYIDKCSRVVEYDSFKENYIITSYDNKLVKNIKEWYFNILKVMNNKCKIIVKAIIRNIDLIEQNRINGLEKVSKELLITKERLDKYLKDIQLKLIENGLVKKLKNGQIILMLEE